MSDIPEDIMAEAEDLAAELPMRVLTDQDSVATVIARALMGHEAVALRQERDDARASYANMLNIIADIREKSGVGGKPMLGELADSIEARMAAAEQRGEERAEWQPIETAPKDGRLAIVYRPLARLSHDEPVAVKRLVGGNHHCWEVTVPEGSKPCNPTDGSCHVTHWQPLPSPPASDAAIRRGEG